MPSTFWVLKSVCVIIGTPQLSVPVAEPVFEGSVLAVQAIITSTGQVIEGGVLSSIVIVCVQVLILPQASVAFHVLVIVDSQVHLFG